MLYPYVYLAARAAFLAQSQPLLEASRILGHGPWRTFFARRRCRWRGPPIAAGVALALLEALADFGTVQYYGVQTLHDGDLSDLVRPGQSRGRRADRRWS